MKFKKMLSNIWFYVGIISIGNAMISDTYSWAFYLSVATAIVSFWRLYITMATKN